jgi:hypothetical protein
VIAPDDEVGAAVVLADERVEDGFARAGEAHRGGEDAEKGALLRVVGVDQDLVAAKAHTRWNVARPRLADERMDEEAIVQLEGGLQDELVGTMDRVPGLEPDDRSPAALPDDGARVGGVEVIAGELDRARTVHDGDGAAEKPFPLLPDEAGAGMRRIVGAEGRPSRAAGHRRGSGRI